MANIREIQSRINSVKDTMKITNAMYMISSSKMTQAKKKLMDTEPYFYALQGEISRILRHLPELETCAEKVLRERNCSQSVEVSFGESWFPQKTYGEYTFPSGNYEALKVTIGEGDGHNWWCMLYPSMCFPDTFHAVPDEEGEKTLEKVLSDEAYDSVLRHGKLRFSFFLAF